IMELFWSVATMVSVPFALLMRCRPRSLPGVRPRPKRRVTECDVDIEPKLQDKEGRKWRFYELVAGRQPGLAATRNGARRLEDEHGVAVAIEAIRVADGLLVGPAQQVASRERADQQQQRRSRQVEVRDESID